MFTDKKCAVDFVKCVVDFWVICSWSCAGAAGGNRGSWKASVGSIFT